MEVRDNRMPLVRGIIDGLTDAGLERFCARLPAPGGSTLRRPLPACGHDRGVRAPPLRDLSGPSRPDSAPGPGSLTAPYGQRALALIEPRPGPRSTPQPTPSLPA